jgi:isocitrate lyase
MASRMNGQREQIQHSWDNDERWINTKREHSLDDVIKLHGSVDIDYSLSRRGSEILWADIIYAGEPIRALGALSANQAIQMARAGLKAIYVSGWQVAADRNGSMYPDQSLYPADCVPKLVKEINNGLLRADQIDSVEGKRTVDDWMLPLVADCEAGFGGVLNAYEITRAMIEAGAAGVHFEDQLSSEKKCGHLGGKVLVPVQEMINKLKAARLAADVARVPLVIIARTDAESARLLTNDYDIRDVQYIHRTELGEPVMKDQFYSITGGIEMCIERGLAYAPYADMIWMETGKPDLKEARQFAEAIHAKFPGKPLAYNCSPSFNWSAKLTDLELLNFQNELFKMGYKFQFVTLAGFHTLNYSMFKLARDYQNRGMLGYSALQNNEFIAQREDGFDAVKHQRFVGTGYFDKIQEVVTAGRASTTALGDSTETEQFK